MLKPDNTPYRIPCAGPLFNPSEQAVCDGAIAWTAGKAVVLFKDDARSLIAGLDNRLWPGWAPFAW